ncbi:MAG: hypothetical protein IPN01_30065 [Deltaproteobacteria bacterium]|nr:hypothetical protein [Deltaproteobacteria bacterium]
MDDSFAMGQIVITEDGDDEVPGVSLKPWDPLTGPGAGNASAIVFPRGGWLSNPPGDFNARGYIEFHAREHRRPATAWTTRSPCGSPGQEWFSCLLLGKT